MYLSHRRDGDNLEVELAGSWRGADLPGIEAELGDISADGVRELRISIPQGLDMDLAGAWRLREWLDEAARRGLLGGEAPATAG